MIDLTTRRALVCGATQGIGRACAELLAKLGARVTLVARDEAALRELSAQLAAPGGAADWFAVDFANPAWP